MLLISKRLRENTCSNLLEKVGHGMVIVVLEVFKMVPHIV